MSHQLWYTRRNDDVRGPFPQRVIAQYLLIGRLHDSDEVSLDRKSWQKINEVEELIPEVMKADLTDPIAQDRLEAARRAADERSLDRRQQQDNPDQNRRGTDRREFESPEEVTYRKARLERMLEARRDQPSMMLVIPFLGVVLGVMIWVIWEYKPETQFSNAADCAAAPGPKVNWNNCFMQGIDLQQINMRGAEAMNANFSGSNFSGVVLADADLSYTNLSMSEMVQSDFRFAKLVGAAFQGSNLQGADLSGSDLSYADFWGADLSGAKLEGAKLDRAIWVDRTICAMGSVGRCIPGGKFPTQ
ncbi:MAG: pentapeptide repeat-containing protein [Gammaproteobacteria bacterium]|nr:pentapeptide repeat-containing protein [Gammaproteobacteria bacterium]